MKVINENLKHFLQNNELVFSTIAALDYIIAQLKVTFAYADEMLKVGYEIYSSYEY